MKVYYTGTLINGTIFDGTSPGLPATFKVNSVIPGWIEALQLMREGDHWQLVIPPNLGYGARGVGDGLIPPNQTLVFDLKLIDDHARAQEGRQGLYPRSQRQGRPAAIACDVLRHLSRVCEPARIWAAASCASPWRW